MSINTKPPTDKTHLLVPGSYGIRSALTRGAFEKKLTEAFTTQGSAARVVTVMDSTDINDRVDGSIALVEDLGNTERDSIAGWPEVSLVEQARYVHG